MLINADFSKRTVITPEDYKWVASPQNGVERVMLDRIGAEKARATSIVRYAPESHFPEHVHPGGEEILVLGGVFSENGRDFPTGWYLRNPPGSSHQPSSKEGALIFVKLWQFSPNDSETVRVNTNDPAAWRRAWGRDTCLLFENSYEKVSVEKLDAEAHLQLQGEDGAELLILSGELLDGQDSYPKGTWLRLPAGGVPRLRAGKSGACFYLKTGHLKLLEKHIPATSGHTT